MGWMVRELKPGEGDIFRTRPNRLWGFFTIATGSLPHVQSGQVVPLTTHRPLGPRLRKEYSYTFILPLRLHDLLQSELHLLPTTICIASTYTRGAQAHAQDSLSDRNFVRWHLIFAGPQ